MEENIEKKFLSAFKIGGVVCNCIDWMREQYDLRYMPQKDRELHPKWRHHYDVVLPKSIFEDTEAFDDSVIIYYNSSTLINEIKLNLDECTTDAEKERYIFSLLIPFKEYSDAFHSTALIKNLEKAISKAEHDKLLWQNVPETEVLYDTAGKPSASSKKQVEACDYFIERYKKDIERYRYISTQFINLTCRCDENAKWMKEGTVESCLHAFVHVVHCFANHLDALLLYYCIDLMELQIKCGVYLKPYRLITDIDMYVGSPELTEKYINDLKANKKNNPENDKEQQVTYNINAAVVQTGSGRIELSNNTLIGGLNNTVTINDTEKAIFNEIRHLVNTQMAASTTIIEALDELERNYGQSSFKDKYTDFIAAAANHITILAPFIPVLTDMIPNN
ncbi:MAG: hypothetical protein SNJ31_06890 [Rikenellaceae bacterium]